MGEAEAEQYARKVYWDLCGNSPQAHAYTATRRAYDEEIINLKKIAMVLGVKEDSILSWDSENDYGRNKLRSLFTKLTGREDFWDSLEYQMDSEFIKDDDVFRILQFRGKKLVNVQKNFSPDCPPIEIAFPKNCNSNTQCLKVEIFGHVIADGSINGDVVCHDSVQCAGLNGSLHCNGDVIVGTINSSADISCRDILQCYKIHCSHIECDKVEATNLSCQQLIHKQ